MRSTAANPGRRRQPARRYNAPPPDERRGETKKQKFQRIIIPRIDNALKDIALLRTGADRTRYEISERDIDRLEKTLKGAVDDVIKAYKKPEPVAPTKFMLNDLDDGPPATE